MNNGLTIRNVVAMVIDPSTPSTLYVAIGSDFQSGTGVYKSTDGGGNLDPPQQRNHSALSLVSLAIDPFTPNTLYVGVGCCSWRGSHIYKTTDGADNWAPIPNAPPGVSRVNRYRPAEPFDNLCGGRSNPGRGLQKHERRRLHGNFIRADSSSVRSVAVSPHTAGLVYASTRPGLIKKC